jgi:hypothetical protein
MKRLETVCIDRPAKPAERQTSEWHERKRAEWEATFGLAGNVPVGPSVATAGPETGCWLRRMWDKWGRKVKQ